MIRIYDIAGRSVRTLVDQVEDAGKHAVAWDGSLEQGDRASSGIYFVQIEFPDGAVRSRKLTILR